MDTIEESIHKVFLVLAATIIGIILAVFIAGFVSVFLDLTSVPDPTTCAPLSGGA